VYVRSAKDAPRFKVVAFDITTGSMANATPVIAAGSRVIDGLAAAKDALYVTSREDGLGRISRVGYDGKVSEIPVPVNGTVGELTARYDTAGFLARLESWTTSPLWYAYAPGAPQLLDTKLDPLSPVDFSAVVAEEVKTAAPDGTLIPLSIIHRRDLKLDGTNPTVLYAYGSYGISSSPSFAASRLPWFEHGGVLAVAHVRGGGEYGEEWHLAGKDANKINTIKDYIACARYLIDKKYTSPGRLGGRGAAPAASRWAAPLAKRPNCSPQS